MPTISASALRADIYRVIERVARTGQPVDVTSKGRRVRIVAVDDPPSRLDVLTPHPDAVVGDLDDLVHIDWSDEWHP